MNLWRYSGWMLIATGVLHNIIGIVVGWEILSAMIADGIWNSIEAAGEASAQWTRAAMLWFLMLGFAWIMLGTLMQNTIRHSNRPLPRVWGWLLLANGILVAVILPASGAWLFLPQGLIILLAKQHNVPPHSLSGGQSIA